MPHSDDTPLSLRTERIKRAGEKQRATTQPGFPATRLRRTRMQDWSRRLVRETHLGVDNLVWPLFVIEGDGARQAIDSMPGVERLSIDLAIEAAKEAAELGLPAMFTERVDGRFTLRRGFEIEAGTRVLMAEDVITTGKSSRECIACIRENGGIVVGATCLIDRSGGGLDLSVPLIALAALDVPTYEESELPPDLAEKPAVKPGSRGLR